MARKSRPTTRFRKLPSSCEADISEAVGDYEPAGVLGGLIINCVCSVEGSSSIVPENCISRVCFAMYRARPKPDFLVL